MGERVAIRAGVLAASTLTLVGFTVVLLALLWFLSPASVANCGTCPPKVSCPSSCMVPVNPYWGWVFPALTVFAAGVIAGVATWIGGRRRGVGAERHQRLLRGAGAAGVAGFVGGWVLMLFFGGHTPGPWVVVSGFTAGWVAYVLSYRGVLRQGDPRAGGHPDIEGYPRTE